MMRPVIKTVFYICRIIKLQQKEEVKNEKFCEDDIIAIVVQTLILNDIIVNVEKYLESMRDKI